MQARKILIVSILAVAALSVSIAAYIFYHRDNIIEEYVAVEQQYQFGDMQNVQLEAAKRNGIKPINSRDDIGQLKNGVVKISTCRAYKVDRLTHSIPYLTPSAKTLLHDIGTSFQTKLKEKGYEKHRIIVTSVLRTSIDVQKLQQVNGNAVTDSPHKYATTFDITYVRYDRTGLIGKHVSNAEMTNTLGQVLEQLRKEGRCYVKYEKKQHCYHITAR